MQSKRLMLKLIYNLVSFVFHIELNILMSEYFQCSLPILCRFEIAYLIAPCAHMPLNGEKIARIYWLGQRYDSQSECEHFLFHLAGTPCYKGQVLTAESFQNKSLIINAFIVLAAVVLQAFKWNSYSMLQAFNRWPPRDVQYNKVRARRLWG